MVCQVFIKWLCFEIRLKKGDFFHSDCVSSQSTLSRSICCIVHTSNQSAGWGKQGIMYQENLWKSEDSGRLIGMSVSGNVFIRNSALVRFIYLGHAIKRFCSLVESYG